MKTVTSDERSTEQSESLRSLLKSCQEHFRLLPPQLQVSMRLEGVCMEMLRSNGSINRLAHALAYEAEATLHAMTAKRRGATTPTQKVSKAT